MTGRPGLRLRAVSAVALATAAVLALGACQPEPTPTPTASPSATQASTPSPSPSVSTETWPPAELDALTPADPVDEGEPTAYEAPEWLWDWVDDSWSTAIYSTVEVAESADGGPALEGVQWLYLLAPDGTAFRIADLGHDAFATIVDWDADHRQAWLHLQGWGESWDVAEVALETGDVDTEDFTDGAGPRDTVESGGLSADLLPRDVAADGTRLWIAVSPFGDMGGTVWYEPVAGEWKPSSVNDALFDIAQARHARGDDSEHSPGPIGGSGWVSIESERAISMVADAGGQGAAAPTYVIFDHDLGDDTYIRTGFTPPDSATGCQVHGPDGDEVVVRCWNVDTSVPDTGWAVDLDSSDAVEVPVDPEQTPNHDLGSYTEDVKTQGTQPPNADDWTDLMPAPPLP
ncbi:hypothetical protein [Demequina muriae]|uniref:Uncharacterized protein n=1 Tax=Demequina muriae TaxID=3051664 RepID=A0ABT8GGR2_9MICO|nr:hypothetical protein [Demequina sp. EGI L300058]MDN4480626.1 hypothetical protein [Demequina sp. EGI L300058]